MFTAKTYQFASTLDEACEILEKNKTNTVAGGCCWLRMGKKRIWTAVDLTRLNLDYIRREADGFHIGAMTTLRDLETCGELQKAFGGILPECVSRIVGVQFRNMATVGGSVFMRAGYSDLLTALMALDMRVVLHKGGEMPLADFMTRPYERDILKEIIIAEDGRSAAYESLRMTATDFPVLAVAVSRCGDNWTVSVGARPAKACRAPRAEALLAAGDIDGAAKAAADELVFGTNMRGSAEYRQKLARVLVKRAAVKILEGNCAK